MKRPLHEASAFQACGHTGSLRARRQLARRRTMHVTGSFSQGNTKFFMTTRPSRMWLWSCLEFHKTFHFLFLFLFAMVDRKKKRALAVCSFFSELMYTVICHHSLPIPPNLLLGDHHHRKRTRRFCNRKCFEEIENSGLLFLMWAHCVFPVKRKRRFWCAMRSAGAWNLEVLENWESMGRNWNVEDWKDEKYQNLLRMSKLAFRRLHASIWTSPAAEKDKLSCIDSISSTVGCHYLLAVTWPEFLLHSFALRNRKVNSD